MKYILACIAFCIFSLHGKRIETFYGAIAVEEPVLLELIESSAFQRLKYIHQYGVSYYTTHREEYTRYAHSLGVFAVLRLKGSSLEEQIAGLLHDVSHTAFSHVGDWIFGMHNLDSDYQSSIHKTFIQKSGLGSILEKYHISIDRILPVEEQHPALEQKIPNLCADRIDYNIQGAYYQHFITYEEAKEIFDDLQFVEGKWLSTKQTLLAKLVRFSLFMTQNCWGSPRNYLASRWLADAILEGIRIQSLSYEIIHFGTDQLIWDLLSLSKSPVIQKKMHMVLDAESYFQLVDPSHTDFTVKSKFRGIDPWIFQEGKAIRLTAIDSNLSDEYQKVKKIIENGWPVQLN